MLESNPALLVSTWPVVTEACHFLRQQGKRALLAFIRRGALRVEAITAGHSTARRARLAAAYVNKILKGASPADLPIQQPTRFPLYVNVRTPKAIGISMPKELLLRAERVIE